MKKKHLVTAGIWAALIGALLIRLWAAWDYQYDLHYDRGRAMLMTRHIMNQQDFPVFNYGAPHLGSLETAIAAVICNLTGFNLFTANLGTIFFSTLLLITVYFWTQKASDRLGGLLALIFLLIGPFGFFVFSVLPRGGYAATMLLETVLLYLTGCIIIRDRKRTSVPTWMYWLLGCIGGLAWWTNQILTAALLTSACWMLFTMQLRLLNRKTAGMVILFFLASAPWWIWNFYNHWESASFIPSLFGTPLLHGLKLFFWDRMFNLINLPSSWGPLRFLIPVLYAGLIFYSLFFAITHLKHRKDTTQWIMPGIALSFLAIYAVLFSKSPFTAVRSARYLVPVIPVLAVLTGISLTDLSKRLKHAWLCLLPLVILCTAQFSAFITEQTSDSNQQPWKHAQQLAAFCQSNHIEVVFVNRWDNWMNIAAEEQVIFCDFSKEAYAPYEKAGNQTDSPALLNNAFNIEGFLTATRATCSVATVGTDSVYYDFTDTPHPAKPLNPANIVRITEYPSQTNITGAITDQDCDTSWKSVITTNGPAAALRIQLDSPQELNGIRLWCNNERYPASCQVEGRNGTNDTWHVLLPNTPTGPYYWSGPRWYINGLFYRMMYRFNPTAPVNELRVTFPPCPQYDYPIELTELQLLGKTDTTSPEKWQQSLPDLTKLLHDRNIMRCFADRWLSAKIHQATAGAVEVVMPAFMQRSIYSGEQQIINEYFDIQRLSPNDGILVPIAEADALKQILNQRRITMRQTPLGPWILFDFAAGQYTRVSAIFPGLKWVGFGCLDNSEVNQKHKGHYFYREAQYAAERDKKLTYLTKALELYPRHKAALENVIELSESINNRPLAQFYQSALDRFTPEISTPVTFENGIKLLGISPINMAGSSGGSVSFNLFWECPPHVNPEAYAVFIHIKKNGDRFQGDHVLLEKIPEEQILQQITSETFVDHRTVSVPVGTSMGTYQVVLGLYNRHTGFRLKPDSPLKTHRNGVILPVTIEITAPKS